MKVPEGWKSFFFNTFVAFVVIFGANSFLGNNPTVGGSLIFATIICAIIAFIESRIRQLPPTQ